MFVLLYSCLKRFIDAMIKGSLWKNAVFDRPKIFRQFGLETSCHLRWRHNLLKPSRGFGCCKHSKRLTHFTLLLTYRPIVQINQCGLVSTTQKRDGDWILPPDWIAWTCLVLVLRNVTRGKCIDASSRKMCLLQCSLMNGITILIPLLLYNM